VATTPPFMPGEIPGLGSASGTTIPGIPTAPRQPPAAPDDQQAKQILATILQAAQRKQMANTAVPSAVPGMQDPTRAMQAGMGTAWPHAWGGVRFAGTVGAVISNAVAMKKQAQLKHAEGQWGTLQSDMNELYAAKSSGDPGAVEAAQKKVDMFFMENNKDLKKMAKALNQDWLNPEKTDVWKQALNNTIAKDQQKQAEQGKKQQAAEGLKKMFDHLIRKSQQPQLSDEQKKAIGREIQEKAPTATPGLDKAGSEALRDELKARERELEDERKAALKSQEDERKEAARAKEQETKFQQEKEVLDMKQKYTEHRDQMQNDFHRTMETLKENAAEQRQNTHDMMMMKQLGMKLDAQQEKLFKPDPQKLNKDVTDTIGTLKQQYAQANQKLRALKASATGHWIMGPGEEEIKSAQDDADSLQKAIGHIEKNRDAIIKGKAELGDVVNKAYDIMGGTPDAAPPPPPPGFVVNKP
jgi:hypothetical protein